MRIQGSAGGGTGVVFNAAKGLVLTNNHVITGSSGLNAQIGNETSNTSPVQVVATSPCDDLAVVKLTNQIPGLKALKLGDSGSVTPGDEVTALGFPESLQSGKGSSGGIPQATTAVSTTGRVSQANVAVNTTESDSNFDPSSPPYQSMIVHGAAINHGNSGGPLLNSAGEVIGINTLSLEGTQGVYYSIASNYIKRVLPQLEAGKSEGYIGWDLAQLAGDNNPELEEDLLGIYRTLRNRRRERRKDQGASQRPKAFLEASPPTVGMYDQSDDVGSPAARAHVEGYMVLAINKTPVNSCSTRCAASSTPPRREAHCRSKRTTSTTAAT